MSSVREHMKAYCVLFRAVFWVVLPCKMIVDRRFRGTVKQMLSEMASSDSSLIAKSWACAYIEFLPGTVLWSVECIPTLAAKSRIPL
jgi:hypothetical protein